MNTREVSRETQKMLEKLRGLIPGGVDGNVKYFEGMPVVKRAYGSRIVDVDDHEYIDFCCGYGPLIFGHDDPEWITALTETLRNSGLLYGLPHPLMEEAASLVSRCVKCAEMVRFTNSGTEATLACIRLARAVTGRDKIVKFYGAYHGTHESVLIGTKVMEREPKYPYVGANSAGISQGTLRETFVLPFNDRSFAEDFIGQHAEDIAAIILEPVLGGYGIVAEKEFLECLRSLATRHGILLIFDEVITGFRLAIGGAQELFGVVPDLAALGKAMGGGFPIGAFVGLRKYMGKVVPTGNPLFDGSNVVYHSGTYNANPVAMTAIKTSIRKLMEAGVHRTLNSNGKILRDHLQYLMKRYGVKGTTTGIGSMVQWYFGVEGDVKRPEELVDCNKNLQSKFHSLLLGKGIFFIPGPKGYVSTAHTPSDIDRTLEDLEDVFRSL